MQITENSTVRFREGAHRAGIIGTVEHVNLDMFDQVKSLNVRILRGQEGAGQIVSTFPEHVEEMDTEDTSREVPPYDLPVLDLITVSPLDLIKEWMRGRTPIDWIGILGGLILGVFLLLMLLQNLGSKSEMTRSVEELNQINLQDSKDLEIKREAERKIEERKPRKKELLKQIRFE